MNRQRGMEQTRQASIQAWAQAQRQALHEAVKNTPVNNQVVGASGTGSGGVADDFVAMTTVDNSYMYISAESADRASVFTITVDWGDGNTDTYAGAPYYDNITHEYDVTGTYIVTITGELASIDGFQADNNYISEIKGLQKLVTASYIDLSYNSLTEIPVLPAGLEQLAIRNNQITGEVAVQQGLVYFYADYNNITGFKSISSELLELSAEYNAVSEWTLQFPVDLELLSLRSNQLSSFRWSAMNAGLQGLNLAQNQLTAWPDVALPAGLISFNIWGNRITGFNPAYPLPAGINYVDLSGNLLTTFTPGTTFIQGKDFLISIVLQNMPGLTTFNMPANTLESINSSLSLAGTGITAFNETNLPAVGQLYLSGAQLTQFTPTVVHAGCNYYDISDNNLNTAAVNAALINLDSKSSSFDLINNRRVYLKQRVAAPPSGAGITAKNNLISRNWTIDTD